jgi:hypothetical protein
VQALLGQGGLPKLGRLSLVDLAFAG